jgi:hypothetical protein
VQHGGADALAAEQAGVWIGEVVFELAEVPQDKGRRKTNDESDGHSPQAPKTSQSLASLFFLSTVDFFYRIFERFVTRGRHKPQKQSSHFLHFFFYSVFYRIFERFITRGGPKTHPKNTLYV